MAPALAVMLGHMRQGSRKRTRIPPMMRIVHRRAWRAFIPVAVAKESPCPESTQTFTYSRNTIVAITLCASNQFARTFNSLSFGHAEPPSPSQTRAIQCRLTAASQLIDSGAYLVVDCNSRQRREATSTMNDATTWTVQSAASRGAGCVPGRGVADGGHRRFFGKVWLRSQPEPEHRADDRRDDGRSGSLGEDVRR